MLYLFKMMHIIYDTCTTLETVLLYIDTGNVSRMSFCVKLIPKYIIYHYRYLNLDRFVNIEKLQKISKRNEKR